MIKKGSKRITITLSQEDYDTMLYIIDEVNKWHDCEWIVSKSDYITQLIKSDTVSDWIGEF